MNVANKYRPGAINVQVNGVQLEDMFIQWQARTRECEELRKTNKAMSEQLKEQGRIIVELKTKLKEKEN